MSNSPKLYTVSPRFNRGSKTSCIAPGTLVPSLYAVAENLQYHYKSGPGRPRSDIGQLRALGTREIPANSGDQLCAITLFPQDKLDSTHNSGRDALGPRRLRWLALVGRMLNIEAKIDARIHGLVCVSASATLWLHCLPRCLLVI